MLITGDTHGDFFDRIRVLKRDYSRIGPLIVTGDFGLICDPRPSHRQFSTVEAFDMRQIQATNIDWLFVDGNHENFTRLNRFPVDTKYGNDVGVISSGIYHLLRGRVYTIDDKRVWVMGGGVSIDKSRRIPFIDWWPREIPSKAEEDLALNELDQVDWQVDMVVTHAAPNQARGLLEKNLNGDYGCMKMNDNFFMIENRFLSKVAEKLKFNHWYFGHYHFNDTMGKFTCLYEDIKEIYEA